MNMELSIDALERALIFLRLRLSLRERFFFHFSLMMRDFELQQTIV